MSRSASMYGLTEEAQKFLEENEKRNEKETCETCGHTEGGDIIRKIYNKAHYVYEDFDLHEFAYKEPNKPTRFLREVVQEDVWSGGPCIFLCLRDADGNRTFEWTDDEMHEICGDAPYREEE